MCKVIISVFTIEQVNVVWVFIWCTGHWDNQLITVPVAYYTWLSILDWPRIPNVDFFFFHRLGINSVESRHIDDCICFKVRNCQFAVLLQEASNDIFQVTVSQASTCTLDSIIAKVNFIKCFNFFLSQGNDLIWGHIIFNNRLDTTVKFAKVCISSAVFSRFKGYFSMCISCFWACCWSWCFYCSLWCMSWSRNRSNCWWRCCCIWWRCHYCARRLFFDYWWSCVAWLCLCNWCSCNLWMCNWRFNCFWSCHTCCCFTGYR